MISVRKYKVIQDTSYRFNCVSTNRKVLEPYPMMMVHPVEGSREPSLEVLLEGNFHSYL